MVMTKTVEIVTYMILAISQSCHQIIASQTSVTNIDLALSDSLSLKYFSKTHDACYSMESAKRTAGNRHRCDNLLGHNLLMGCKYIINSKGFTLDQCLRKAHMMTVFCKSFCFLGFKNDGKRCKIIN